MLNNENETEENLMCPTEYCMLRMLAICLCACRAGEPVPSTEAEEAAQHPTC